MRVSTQFGFAFICVPRCASTTIESAIDSFCNMRFAGHKLKHIDARTYSQFVRPLHEKLFPSQQIETFCIVRDPVERMRSWYLYRSRKQLKAQKPAYYTGHVSFEEFVESFVTEGETRPYANLKSQYEFIRLDRGSLGVDRIIPFERIELVEDFILEKTGTRIELPHKNASRGKHRNLDLDQGLEERLRHRLRHDADLHNLAKEHSPFLPALHAHDFTSI